jgi:hypothetical protein
LDGGGNPKTIEARVYQFSAKQVRIIGVFVSEGSSTPQYSILIAPDQKIRIQLKNSSN